MLFASDLKKGSRIVIDDDPYTVMETTTQTPSARGAASLVKVRVRNLKTDQVLDKSFKTGERFNEPDLERRPVQYLYDEDDKLVFMDQQSYEQIYLSRDEVGDAAQWLTDAMELKLVWYNGQVLDIELPTTVEFEIDTTEPIARGDTARGSVFKPAQLTNGMRIMVPPYIKEGDRIRVNTKDGTFAERVS